MTPTIEQNQQPKKTIFSAIQPSGTITLGNYLGALQNWIKLQDDYNCIFALADLHTITVRQDPATFRKNTIEAYALLLACEKSILYSKPCAYPRRVGLDSELLHPVRRVVPHDAI